FNPSVDYVFSMKQFNQGQLHRLNNEVAQFFPGGKGINVSRVLKELGYTTVATGFVGGFTGHYINAALESENILTNFVTLKTPTRMNLKMKTGQIETEINGEGPVVTEDELNQLSHKIMQLNHGDYLILSGSRQGSIPFDFYHEILQE